ASIEKLSRAEDPSTGETLQIVIENAFNPSLMNRNFMRVSCIHSHIRHDRGSLYASLRRWIPESHLPHLASFVHDLVYQAKALEHLERSRLKSIGLASSQGTGFRVDTE
ncbi:hypothetical protein KEM55_004597, partial [Ascosphaera atra]